MNFSVLFTMIISGHTLVATMSTGIVLPLNIIPGRSAYIERFCELTELASLNLPSLRAIGQCGARVCDVNRGEGQGGKGPRWPSRGEENRKSII